MFMPIPNRILKTLSSLGVNDAKILVVDSLKLDWIAVSSGCKAFLSSIKSPRLLSSSSPTGVSSDTGSLAIFKTFLTFSNGIASFFANSSGVGSRPNSLIICLCVLTILLIVSIMWTGILIVLAWSAIDRVIACLIHHVA